MRYCENCGNQVGEVARFCPNCGHAQGSEDQPPQHQDQQPTIQVTGQPPPQEGSVAWVGRGMGIGLGACIVGLIIFVGVPLFLLVGCLVLGSVGAPPK
jgi:uncharacterized membrane protein YvbJ